jgi:RmuC family
MGIAIAAVAALVVAGLVWFALTGLRRSVESRLTSTDEELRRLAEAAAWRERGASDVRQEISGVRGALEEFRAREQERRAREEQGWETLHRVASVLAGGQRAGRAGENVLRESLAHLPPAMVVTDFRVNGRVVEFGLVLPDGKRLPVDSKWPAERELLALAEETDPVERDRLIRVVERTVADRAREVAGYRDPAVTASVGVAAVPDAAYALLRRAHADAYRQGVIVIPYSMALPVLLFLYTIVSRFGSVGDVEACLGDLAAALDAMEASIENKVAKASAMLRGGTEELRTEVGKARTTLARARDAEQRGGPALLPAETGGGADLGLADDRRPRLVGLSP